MELSPDLTPSFQLYICLQICFKDVSSLPDTVIDVYVCVHARVCVCLCVCVCVCVCEREREREREREYVCV